MKRLRIFLLLAVAALLVGAGLLATAHAARAQTSAAPDVSYSITWYTVDGGGGASTGSGYTLTGTAGQPDAGTLTSLSYTVAGGFWAGVTNALHNLFLPLVRR